MALFSLYPIRTLVAVTLASAVVNALALDLGQAWQASSGHDPQAAMADATRSAGQARSEQSKALWRPNVAFSGSVGLANADTAMNGAHFSAPGLGASNGVDFATSVNNGTSTRWALTARQPLFSPERQAQSRQLEISAGASEIEWHSERQQLMLRTAQRYFDVAVSTRHLELLLQQQKQAEQTLVEARDRFALGDKPVTDTHEAQARAQGLRAQVLAAQAELTLAQAALADTTGLAPDQLSVLQPADVAGPEIAPLAHWQELALAQNDQLRLLQAQIDAAQQESAKHSAAASTTLDLIAQASREQLSGNGNFGTASTSVSQQMIGLQLSLPIYTGGYRDAKQEEAQRLELKARAELEMARQQVSEQVQSAWLGVQTGQARLVALAASLTASNARLDATRLGRQVGDRTTLDLLQAQNDAAGAELALVQARVELLLNRLRLHALSGDLEEKHLQEIDALLRH